MNFLNEKLVNAMFGGDYICSECGAKMEFEDKWEDVLICPACGYETDMDHYGFENDEEYEALYPTKEEIIGCDEYDNEDEDGIVERYDDVCGELDDYAPPNL